MPTPTILFVADLAKRLNRTVSAVRSGVHRNAEWIPPRMATRRLQWSSETVDAFLAWLEQGKAEGVPFNEWREAQRRGARAKKGTR